MVLLVQGLVFKSLVELLVLIGLELWYSGEVNEGPDNFALFGTKQ